MAKNNNNRRATNLREHLADKCQKKLHVGISLNHRKIRTKS